MKNKTFWNLSKVELKFDFFWNKRFLFEEFWLKLRKKMKLKKNSSRFSFFVQFFNENNLIPIDFTISQSKKKRNLFDLI